MERQTEIAPQPPQQQKRDDQFSDEALLLTDAPVPRGAPSLDRPRVDKCWIESTAGEAEWADLAAHAVEPNPFYEPELLAPALRAFGEGVETLFIHAPHPSRAKGKKILIGLFPMSSRRGRVELWKHQYCYLTTPLLRIGYEAAAIQAWLDWCAAKAPLVRLEDVPGDGPLRLRLVDELNGRNWSTLVTQSYTRAFLRRSESAETFLEQSLGGKRRKELRRQRTRLAEMGTLEASQLAPGEDPTPWVRDLTGLELAGWKGREQIATALRDCDRQFLDEACVRAAASGKLQMLALRLNGKAIASKLNFLSGEGGFAFKIAFDESYARFSPGVQLELENIRAFHQRPGLAWMDSCAAPNRFMINHLWPSRRELQTIFFSTGGALGSAAVAAIPVIHLFRSLRRPR
jgi:CelD/BcsL family acetyltransferase involved in cellulose biosynthesis